MSNETVSAQSESEGRRDLVRDGYDAIAQTYLNFAIQNDGDRANPRMPQIERLLKVLEDPAAASVLELGCGAGVPGTQRLAAATQRVIANDISSAQVELARTHVTAQNVEFVAEDMTKLQYAPASFDAVVGFYSVIHLPQEDQKVMFSRIASWLKPNGYLLCNLGAKEDPGSTERDWLGTKMYWSSFGADANRQMLLEAGFEFVYCDVHEEEEDGQMVPFQWILARKSPTGGK